MTASRLGLMVILMLGRLAAPLPAHAQPADRIVRIGILGINPSMPFDAFRQGLRELRYIEGQNLTIESRFAASDDRLADLAAELVRLKVDVIVVGGHTPAIQAAKQATSTIPIVFAVAGDPVGTGLVASLARPGRNVTGLSFLAPDLAGKRLQLLKEAFPEASRVAVLWNAANPSKATEWRETQVAGRALRLTLQSLEIRGPNDFEGAFGAMTKGPAGALIVLPDTFTLVHRNQIVGLAAKSRLPAMYGTKEFVDAGGLMSYAPSLPAMFRRAATYVDKILRGANPADLPVELPTRFEIVINMKTAKALGLRIPQALLLQADQVIE